MTRSDRLFVPLLAALAASAFVSGAAQARVNLGNFGVRDHRSIGGIWDPIDPPGTGGVGNPTVGELETQGFACSAGNLAAIECRSCGFEPVGETFTCSVHLCADDGRCGQSRRRYGVPASVDTEGYGLWAVEFALGSASYWLGDFDGDGRRDLGAQHTTVRAALSRGTFFHDLGVWTSPAPVESAGPSALWDVNGDGLDDVLSVSAAGHLVVGFSNGTGIAARVELPNTWCEGLGDCLIGDVNGDGFPDLVEVMRGAVDGQRPGDAWVSLGSDVPGFPALPDPPAPRDTDGDGVPDRDDVCTEALDPAQLDADGDGIGNACDADLDQDGLVGSGDFDAYVACFLADLAARPECAAADFDGDGAVTIYDYLDVLLPALGARPGPSAADLAPEIVLFSPVDGAILPNGSQQAWVAGWLPDVPEGDVTVLVAGAPVALSGPENHFSTFVDLPPGSPSLFRPIVVEAMRNGAREVARRVVLVGDSVRPGARARGALGARLTAEGLARIEQHLQTVVAQQIYEAAPAAIEGYRHDSDCVTLGGVIVVPICWNGYEISNAALSGPPVIDVTLEPDAIRIHASLASLSFDWEVDVEGPNCGDSVTVSGIEIDLRYGLELLAAGQLEVRELQEPQVEASFSIDGCWGGGHGAIESGVRNGLAGFLNDPDDIVGTIYRGPRTGPAGGAIQRVFRKLDVSGSVATQIGDTPLELAYDARFDSVAQDASGVAVWLRAGIDAAAPVEGLGGPNGAYQLPGATTPQLPGLLPSRDPFHVAAAITPNGWNELLDALTRAGFLESQAFTLTELDLFGNGSTTPINAGLLQFLVTGFARYPALEPIAVRVSPSGVAPVVSGRRGPGGEAIDVQLAQVGIEFVDASGVVALGLRADARVGVDVGLATSGAGTLGATARRLELLGFTIVENRIGADLQQVATNLLCVDADPSAALSCAIASLLSDGLDHVLASAALPSLEDGTDGFALTPKCLVRLDDGSLVAEFLLRLPGDPAPPRLPGVASIGDCVAPPIADGGSSGGAVGPVQGEVLTEGFLLRN